MIQTIRKTDMIEAIMMKLKIRLIMMMTTMIMTVMIIMSTITILIQDSMTTESYHFKCLATIHPTKWTNMINFIIHKPDYSSFPAVTGLSLSVPLYLYFLPFFNFYCHTCLSVQGRTGAEQHHCQQNTMHIANKETFITEKPQHNK